VASARIGGKPVRFAAGPRIRPTHDAAYWEAKTKGFDFSVADRVPAAKYNRVLWEGLMPGKAYPVELANRSAVSQVAADRDDD